MSLLQQYRFCAVYFNLQTSCEHIQNLPISKAFESTKMSQQSYVMNKVLLNNYIVVIII